MNKKIFSKIRTTRLFLSRIANAPVKLIEIDADIDWSTIEETMMELEEKFEEGVDYKAWIAMGDDIPHAIEIYSWDLVHDPLGQEILSWHGISEYNDNYQGDEDDAFEHLTMANRLDILRGKLIAANKISQANRLLLAQDWTSKVDEFIRNIAIPSNHPKIVEIKKLKSEYGEDPKPAVKAAMRVLFWEAKQSQFREMMQKAFQLDFVKTEEKEFFQIIDEELSKRLAALIKDYQAEKTKIQDDELPY